VPEVGLAVTTAYEAQIVIFGKKAFFMNIVFIIFLIWLFISSAVPTAGMQKKMEIYEGEKGR
jgi:hypothetical protein